MAALRCSVALPTRSLFYGVITYAGVPGAEGSFGVLPGHELMVSLNSQGGVLTLHTGNDGQETREFLIMGGATSVLDGMVTVLARFGTAVEDIDEAAVRDEAEEYRNAISALESRQDAQDEATLETNRMKLDWCEAQLRYVGEKKAAA